MCDRHPPLIGLVRQSGGAIQFVHEPIDLGRVVELASERFGDMIKAVVDVERRVMVLGGAMHSDEEAALLDDGSRQADLWGINLYPEDHPSDGWIEFDSMINIRPDQGNRSRGVEDVAVQTRIRALVAALVRADA